MEQKNIYITSNDYKTFYSNDILISGYGDTARISFLDTKIPLPESSILDNNGNLIFKYNEDKYLEKILNCEVIIPAELIPNIIESLQTSYNNYKNYLNNKKEEN